jgi:hypothetical protein
MRELDDVVSAAMFEETDDGFTARGEALEDLIGLLWQWSEGFFIDPEENSEKDN